MLYKSFFKGVVWEPNLEFLQKNIFSYMVSPLDFLEFFSPLCILGTMNQDGSEKFRYANMV